ncbi:hypothetical protein EDC30_1173 [Paucimonas lemoignei]|uniref:Quercetin 2,3-dioxygenase n=1 Tax=Paucimonas lemoignei TaxID=29443 RepID=A0A4R3HP96_PAULE|nr:pirin family protein [Paucimonas lemoignei]TCS33251.1 hypothetical protein EDC30_1173 [Paucimonas lemoignei]
MFQLRKANQRGHSQIDWLDSYHTFSFSDYYDPGHMGWGPLRVINDDTVAPGAGFPTHSHRDMEIISYVLEGELQHKDTLGTGSVIRPGDVQLMEAGTGIAHSEFNASTISPVHFLQIWIIPDRAGIAPSYQQTHFADAEKQDNFRLIVSPDGANGSLRIQQDVRLYSALLNSERTLNWQLDSARKAYIHVARGSVVINGIGLQAGDGVRICEEAELAFANAQTADILLFDLPDQ